MVASVEPIDVGSQYKVTNHSIMTPSLESLIKFSETNYLNQKFFQNYKIQDIYYRLCGSYCLKISHLLEGMN